MNKTTKAYFGFDLNSVMSDNVTKYRDYAKGLFRHKRIVHPFIFVHFGLTRLK